EGREREGVRTEIGLGVAITDRERATLPCADDEAILILEDHCKAVGAGKAAYRGHRSVFRRKALIEKILHQMHAHFAVGLGREGMAFRDEFGAQLAEILDNAVVNQRHVFGGMRMSVGFVWLAVR